MDICQTPGVEEVWFCKSAQVAGTEFALSILGFYAHQFPSPCMFVLADEDTANYMSKERVQRMFEDSTELSKLIIRAKFNLDEITLTNDSYIAMGWASSVAKLASRPMRLLVLDEVDKPGYTMTSKEASAISLAGERAETYIDSLMIGLSTPSLENGNITKRLKKCDVIFDWHVPCPFCEQKQPLRWSPQHCYGFKEAKDDEPVRYRDINGDLKPIGGVVWEGSSQATEEQINAAGYVCGSCGALWSTAEKDAAVLKGEMVPREPITRTMKRVGFHVNRLYSLLADSGNIPKLVDKWLNCQDDPTELQGFINSALAEPWIVFAGKERKAEAIMTLKTDLAPELVPNYALTLTLTADVQENGVWYELRGWDEKSTSGLIKYGFLMKTKSMVGDLAGDLAALKDIAEATYKKEDGRELAVRFCVIDSGYRTSEVYDFCRALSSAVPSKGMKTKQTPIGYSKVDTYPGTGKLIPGGLQLVTFDSTYFKDKLETKLQVNVSDVGAWRLHIDTEDYYGEHYVSEIKDREKGEWLQQSNRPNHLWDCGVLQLVALQILESQGLLQKLAAEEAARKQPKPRPQNQNERPKMW